MRNTVLRTGGVIGVAAAAVLLASVTPAAATTAGPGEGSAYGADASVSLLSGVLGQDALSVRTGELGASNTAGPNSASAVDATLKGLVSAKAITSSANHDTASGDVTAKAELVQVALPVLAALAGRTPTASVISSQCHATAAGITGSSDLADLDLGRIGDVAAATPNLTVGIPGVLQVTADEQIHNADGSLTVNALDIKLLGGQLTGALGTGDIVLASSTCGPATAVATTPPAPGAPEVSVVPAGAPETGDGSLATVIVH
ncbi:MAG TPA: choice-of-anchor P family protein [Pseudonocardiaceae bacterium]|jgi:hypothetical protein|nr:choice-of-anchor P family protein [Pseudonocardiaceae bacterium]